MTKNEVKDLAKILFMKTGMSQKDISEHVGVSEKTVSQWAKTGDWDKLRQATTVTKDNLISKVLMEMESIMDDNEDVYIDENGKPKRKPKKADEMVKLAKTLSTLKDDKLMLPHVIQTFKIFNTFCESLSAEMKNEVILELIANQSFAKIFFKLQNLFIEQNSKKLMY